MSEPDPTPPPADPPRDEIDPELIALRRPRAGVGPILVLSVVGLSIYVLSTLYPDLRFWMSPTTPRDLGTVTAPPAEAGNGYVNMIAVPDRARALRLRGRQDVGRRLAPVQGSSDRLWLELEGDATSAVAAYDERYIGRLRPLSELTFADDLEESLGALAAAPRFVPTSEVGKAQVKTWTGDTIDVAPDARVELEERVPGVSRVTMVQIDASKIPNEAAARAALGAALATAVPAPVEVQPHAWTYEIAGEPADLQARLNEAKLWPVVEPKVKLHQATWSEVATSGDQVVIGGVNVPASAIEHVAVYAKTRLPEGALILVTGEQPQSFWYVPILYAVMAILSAIMIWAFVRTLRPDRGGTEGGAAPTV